MVERIQRKRTKGWKMPPNTVSVTRPGRFGNKFVIGDPSDQARLAHYADYTKNVDLCRDRSQSLPGNAMH